MGRNGDSMLMHVQPREVAGLQALAQANGTNLTINPNTGMPEAFNLGGILGAVAPIAAGFALGPGGFALMNPLTAGITVGALTTALSGGDIGKGLMAGMGGYSGAGLGGNLANAGAGVKTSVEQTAANTSKDAFQFGSMDPGAINKPFMPSAPAPVYNANIQTPVGGMVTGPGSNSFGPNFATKSGGGFDPSALGGNVDLTQTTSMFSPEELAAQSASSNMSGFDYAMKGAKDLVTPEGWQAFKDAGGSGGQLAMMGGSALLGGLEESDLYGKPLKAPNDKYDPYATLNLGGASSEGESGLRLLAGGGPIAFAKGGESMQGGGAGAMEGAAPMRISVSGPSAGAGGFGGSGAWGSYNSFNTGPSVAPEELGLFADQSMIDAARERQNNALRSQTNLGGFGNMLGRNYRQYPLSGMGNQMGLPNNMANSPWFAGSMGGIGGLMGRRNKDNDGVIGSLNLKDQSSIQLATGGTVGTGGLNDLYNVADNGTPPPLSADGYGMGRLDRLARTSADSSAGSYQFAKGGYLDGPGDGMSDSIPATIEGEQPARLADGEFVIPADVVSHLGNGSTKAGSQRLYSMLDKVRHARTGNKKQGKKINPSKFLPA